jgi:hypothetical protein
MTFTNDEITETYRANAVEIKPTLAHIGGTVGAESHQEFVPKGFQVKKARPLGRRKVPLWVFGNKFEEHVLGKEAMNRLAIAYRFWRIGEPVPVIAESLGLTEEYVKQVLKRLRRKKVKGSQ